MAQTALQVDASWLNPIIFTIILNILQQKKHIVL